MSWYFEPSRPLPTEDGLKARSKRGDFGSSWWSRRWMAALTDFDDSARLQRGRRYARSGQVLSLDEEGGGIVAKVQGSRRQPYTVQIALQPLAERQWRHVLDSLRERALLVAQLLSAEIPAEIVSVFEEAGASLLPEQPDDLIADCSCPDYAVICKHIAATHFILAERLDEDPFLLLRLRGLSQEQLLAALRPADEEPQRQAEADQPPPLQQRLDRFYSLQQPLHHFSVTIATPQSSMPLLAQLGQPPFLNDDLQQLLRPIYDSVTLAMVEQAYSEGEQQPAD